MPSIIKIGGAVCLAPETLDAIAQAARTRPILVVHGGGIQLDEALRAHGEPQRIEGLRVTSQDAMQTVCDTLDHIGAQIVDALAHRGVAARHMQSDERLLRATRRADPAGLGRVGTDPHIARGVRLLPGEVHVVGPVGWDDDGPLNINADEAALAIAKGLHAEVLHLATDVAGVLDRDGRCIDSLATADVKTLLDDGTARGGMRPKLRAARDALEAGVGEVRIGDVAAVLAGDGTSIRSVVEVTA